MALIFFFQEASELRASDAKSAGVRASLVGSETLMSLGSFDIFRSNKEGWENFIHLHFANLQLIVIFAVIVPFLKVLCAPKAWLLARRVHFYILCITACLTLIFPP